MQLSSASSKKNSLQISKILAGDKLFLHAAGHPIIYYVLMAFNDHPEINSVTIVASKENQKELQNLVKESHFPKVQKIILGEKTRQKSLEKGFSLLEKIAKKDDVILVHNAANPLVSEEEISQIIEHATLHGASIVGHYITATIKEIDDQRIIKTHDRNKLFAAQTPQAAKFHLLKKAIEKAKKDKFEATDEAMLLENIGQKIVYLEANESNFKITTEADYRRLKVVLGEMPESFHVGFGQDSHRFATTKKGLTLAGLTFPDHPRLEADSDGDIILHAIFNAISQAIGEKSLGFYADPLCEKGIKDSKEYLKIMLKKIKQQKLKLNSVGLMIECKTPKIDPISGQLKKSLSKLLELDTRRIGITATSGENLTDFGRGLGVQCFAIVSLIKS